MALRNIKKKAQYGIGCKLTLTKNTENAVSNKGEAINKGKIKINAIEWFVPHYTPSIIQQNILMNQIIKKMATQLQHTETSVFMKEVTTQNFWNFEIGTQEGINIPIWIFTVFRQSDREHDQNLNNENLCRLPFTSAQCNIGSKRYPDSASLLPYNDDDQSQGYGQMKEAFRARTKDDLLRPEISQDDFRSSNRGYNIHSFGIPYQRNYENAQPVKVECKFFENLPPGLYRYALVLTNRLVSISSDGQRMFELT